ncbi:16S rRNA (guanine(527)-N(7))-methyltransferase RsmG [Agrococcus sediminis]|uniref:Ribosomal RNA small subunit methyltransferase G n=1 Tax=Agrococcus sediminis TaxID=2599924 RepID=A0A5M8QLT2_9MICO|nr:MULTISPECIES: 16S rRNA (guanine(527)-N(7))-methyltransferase RsmG [Agrococcus]KAA6436111.1 16S rRNA (guanine(527)-N(7))-methyltransferase RsmG [Agrococcus sediminis]RWR23786.1 16S rRNA (guanine(527)-N(7))-methyltransferase RsmG [Agrococcus lahaulensis]UOW01712.1 16S rRNA (guanine(527)-N(7))-methyltransferase RsmG [Agrococcus sp. SCSIO52902]
MADATPPLPEAEPAVAAAVFGDRIELARSYTDSLARNGETLGLIGPRELPQLWTRHILNSALLAPLLRGRVGDVGSGAGLPGLVLAIARPDVELTLIEPMERRTEWLQAEVDRLGLDNVTVLRARAEELPGSGRLAPLDQVTARAVSALRTLIPLTAPLVRSGGQLLLLKGGRAQDEIAAAQKAIRKHRLHDVEVLELGADVGVDITRVIRATVDP